MERVYIKAYYDWIEQTAALSDAERGRLFIAILEYGRSGLDPKLDGRESILFPVFKAVIDRDTEKSRVKAENGAKGGRGNKADKSYLKQNKANESKPKLTKDIRHKTKDKDKDNITPLITPNGVIAPQGATPKKFTPPTVAEVRAYCLERQNGVDPERWHDFYSAKGWMVGKNRMKDWRAAVRTWERDEKKPATSPNADFMQQLQAIYDSEG